MRAVFHILAEAVTVMFILKKKKQKVSGILAYH